MMFNRYSPHIFAIYLLAAGLLVLTGCPAEELVTDPCEEGCNDNAMIGAQCGVAEDCATGSFCNLGFPNGYCQNDCEDGASTCGPEDTGVCIAVSSDQATCVASCDAANPNSCGRPETACYPLPDGSGGGVCDMRCVVDADCGGGLACDGVGLCRSPVASCDAMSHQGCPTGQQCFLSPSVGPFCGLPGGARAGEGCANTAGCGDETWCVEGVCQELCDVDDLYACGSNNPGGCRLALRGTRLGVCTF